MRSLVLETSTTSPGDWIVTGLFGNTKVEVLNDLLSGAPFKSIKKLIELNIELLEETSAGPLAVPRFSEYLADDSRRRKLERALNGIRSFSKDYGVEVLKLAIGLIG